MSDLDQIRRTIAEHPQTLDDTDVDRYVSLFVDDARLTAGTTEYVGTQAIRGFIKGYFDGQGPGDRRDTCSATRSSTSTARRQDRFPT